MAAKPKKKTPAKRKNARAAKPARRSKPTKKAKKPARRPARPKAKTRPKPKAAKPKSRSRKLKPKPKTKARAKPARPKKRTAKKLSLKAKRKPKKLTAKKTKPKKRQAKPITGKKGKKTLPKKQSKKAKPKPQEKAPQPRPRLNKEVLGMLSNARVRHLLVDSAGENALEIIKSFSTDLSDEDLAKKLKIKISDIRSTLNHLHNLGVVQYRRHKDSETGWFSYYWSLNVIKMKSWVEEQLSTSSLPDDIETSEYYFCNRCGPGAVYSFVSATDYSFRCPNCAAALAFLDDDCMKEFFPFRNKPKGP